MRIVIARGRASARAEVGWRLARLIMTGSLQAMTCAAGCEYPADRRRGPRSSTALAVVAAHLLCICCALVLAQRGWYLYALVLAAYAAIHAHMLRGMIAMDRTGTHSLRTIAPDLLQMFWLASSVIVFTWYRVEQSPPAATLSLLFFAPRAMPTDPWPSCYAGAACYAFGFCHSRGWPQWVGEWLTRTADGDGRAAYLVLQQGPPRRRQRLGRPHRGSGTEVGTGRERSGDAVSMVSSDRIGDAIEVPLLVHADASSPLVIAPMDSATGLVHDSTTDLVHNSIV